MHSQETRPDLGDRVIRARALAAALAEYTHRRREGSHCSADEISYVAELAAAVEESLELAMLALLNSAAPATAGGV